MSATDLDHCPSCGRRITDTDDTGLEAADGQRWCIAHTPTVGYGYGMTRPDDTGDPYDGGYHDEPQGGR